MMTRLRIWVMWEGRGVVFAEFQVNTASCSFVKEWGCDVGDRGAGDRGAGDKGAGGEGGEGAGLVAILSANTE